MTYKHFLALLSALALVSCGSEDTPKSVAPGPFEEGYKEGRMVYESGAEPWKSQIVQSDKICAEQDALHTHGEAWLAAADAYLSCELPSRSADIGNVFMQARFDARRIAERLSAFALMGAEGGEAVNAPALKSALLKSIDHQQRVFEALLSAMRNESDAQPFFAWGAELQSEAEVLQSWALDAQSLAWREEEGWQSPEAAMARLAQSLMSLSDVLLSYSDDATDALRRDLGFYLGQVQVLAARLKSGLSHISDGDKAPEVSQCALNLGFDMHSVADLLSIVADDFPEATLSQSEGRIVEDFLAHMPPQTTALCEGP